MSLLFEKLGQSGSGCWRIQIGRLVAPFFDHRPLHLSGVGLGVDADLLGDLDTVRLLGQSGNENCLHFAGFLGLEVALLARDVLHQVAVLIAANLLTLFEDTV